ncbi:hypothetical protein [Enterovibrio norvegicus]|uniref:hypothetical protein n=1 Tax=Enterovibrio norvegicus TaxID=188144 RepID=UPI000C8490F4|nr:hypothetical protein [Enterovibrio norvegicus]PMH64619.1 hypothetical protein BCU62_15315 [Enterovibrio norvegicus]
MDKDNISLVFHRAFNILFIENPSGTSLGAFCGVAFNGLLNMFSPYIKQISSFDIESFDLFSSISVWVVLFNLKPYKNRHKINPKLQAALSEIEHLESENKISKENAKLHYQRIAIQIVKETLSSVEQTDPQNASSTTEPRPNQ